MSPDDLRLFDSMSSLADRTAEQARGLSVRLFRRRFRRHVAGTAASLLHRHRTEVARKAVSLRTIDAIAVADALAPILAAWVLARFPDVRGVKARVLGFAVHAICHALIVTLLTSAAESDVSPFARAVGVRPARVESGPIGDGGVVGVWHMPPADVRAGGAA